MRARFSALVQTGPGAHPASCTIGTGSFPGVKSGRGVTLAPHPLLVPWSRKSRAIPLLPLWAVRSVQSLSACTRAHFTFTFTYMFRPSHVISVGFYGLGVSVLAFGTQVRGFKPGRSRRIFKGEKILSTPSFGGEVKPSVPCRRFAACNRTLELPGSRIPDEICRNISRPRRIPPYATRGLLRRWT